MFIIFKIVAGFAVKTSHAFSSFVLETNLFCAEKLGKRV